MTNPSAWAGILSLAFAILIQTAVLAFWLGRLSQRVLSVERASEGSDSLMEKVVKLEVKMDHVEASTAKIGREMEGVNRQLGNIAMGRVGQISEFKS